MQNFSVITKAAIEDLTNARINKKEIISIIVDLKSLGSVLKNEEILKLKLEMNYKKVYELINKLKKPSKLKVGSVDKEWRIINMLGELGLILKNFIKALGKDKNLVNAYGILMEFLSEDRELYRLIKNI
ncbi:MAG: hypothetical protein Q8N88_04480 [Nanoarchaeota archaeon]|nr:hypothetical protein [Nanoarchaeota archaeon]